MSVVEMLIAAILFLLSAGSFSISGLSFKEKGFLFHNANIFALKKERKTMYKKPYYRQSAIVFALIGVLFLVNAIEVISHSGWLFYVVLAVIMILIIYAVASSIMIEKKKK